MVHIPPNFSHSFITPIEAHIPPYCGKLSELVGRKQIAGFKILLLYFRSYLSF